MQADGQLVYHTHWRDRDAPNGLLHAIDLNSGEVRWHRNIRRAVGSDLNPFGILAEGGRLDVLAAARNYDDHRWLDLQVTFDIATGLALTHRPLARDGGPLDNPVAARGRVRIGMDDTDLQLVDLASDEPAATFPHGLDPDRLDDLQVRRFGRWLQFRAEGANRQQSDTYRHWVYDLGERRRVLDRPRDGFIRGDHLFEPDGRSLRVFNLADADEGQRVELPARNGHAPIINAWIDGERLLVLSGRDASGEGGFHLDRFDLPAERLIDTHALAAAAPGQASAERDAQQGDVEHHARAELFDDWLVVATADEVRVYPRPAADPGAD